MASVLPPTAESELKQPKFYEIAQAVEYMAIAMYGQRTGRLQRTVL